MRAKSVRMTAGAMAFTRTLGPNSAANCFVMWMRPAFNTAYRPRTGDVLKAPTEAMLMMLPPSWSFIHARHAACDHASGPRRLTSTVLSHADSGASMSGPAYG